MPIANQEKLDKLKSILEMLDTNLSRAEFVESFKNIVNLVLKVEKELAEKNNKTIAELKSIFEELKDNLESTTNSELSRVINELKEFSAKIEKDQKIALDFIKDKVKNLKGKDGYTPVKGKDYFDGKNGKDGSPDTPDQILDKISGLLEIKEIKGLVEALEELKKIREERRIFGGGFNKMAMDIHILDPYTPTGTIDGANCDFVLTKAPNPSSSLKVWRGGALMSLTGDYTLSGKTLTFLIAPAVGEIIKCEHRI